jgi:hypothetical protein
MKKYEWVLFPIIIRPASKRKKKGAVWANNLKSIHKKNAKIKYD